MELLILILLFRDPFFGLVPLSVPCSVPGALIDRLEVRGVGVLGLEC